MTPSGITVGSPTLGTPSLISMRKGDMHKAFIRWREQLYNSAHRGIAFELTLADWQSIWIASGHYHRRGRHKGEFVMSRPGDTGPYGVTNVAIVPCSANTVEAQSHRTWTAETRAKIARRLKGNKNGLGHVASAAARKRMRKGCKQRVQTDWLAHTTAANQSSAARRKNSEGVKAAWARRRAQEVRP
jgi:hypothetical protein